MKLAFVFPGQGSQSVGMLAELAASETVVQKTFAEASEAVGVDLWALSQEGPEADLNRTENTQPALLAAGVAVWQVWLKRGGVMPEVLAGHSLGEYTALVASGALKLGDAARLVAQRGRFMQEAVAEGDGAMAAILGLDDDVVARVCTQVAEGGVVSAANLNSPGQVVIAGSTDAVARAIVAAKEAGARRAVELPVSVPSHCALMKPAAEQLAAELESVVFQAPDIPVIHNADVAAHTHADGIREALVRQLYQPVRWVECIQHLLSLGVDRIGECGPGKVLTGLMRRIDRGVDARGLVDPASIEKALSEWR